MTPTRRRVPLTERFNRDAAGSSLLIVGVAVALCWANSPWSESYQDLWDSTLRIGWGDTSISQDLRHWTNDALMALFFFVVGLEIKRELVRGELHDPRTAALPAVAAAGGMIVPPLVFLAVNVDGGAPRGWAVPMATDIALAIGVVALLSRHAPRSLRLFLLTLAVVDDVGAVAVIAVFYSTNLDLLWLLLAAGGLAVIVLLRRVVVWPLAYVPLALGVWLATYASGVHATIAGVALAFATPAGDVRGRPVLESLERRLQPVSSYLIVPIFALANTGIALGTDMVRSAGTSRVALGIGAGLVVGKPLGVVGAALLATAFGLRLPNGMSRRHLVAAGMLAGIGFTVSLFVAQLAFTDGQTLRDATIAVLAASCLSGALGAGVLRLSATGPSPMKRRALP
ncbi:MAG TPA: Na+/H+ antiporter NhaA [Acidimicrobiia bacterium]